MHARQFAGHLVVSLACLALLPAAATAARVALVIGNSAYTHSAALPNPVNDAHDIGGALRALGFDVVEGLNLDKRAFENALRGFAHRIAVAEVALVFYAGHGLQVAGQNYLLPVDARLESERDLPFETVRLEIVLQLLQYGREGRTSLVFLDACRDNPLARTLARAMGTRSATLGTGLAPAQSAAGTFIAYATEPGSLARDGRERNSPFTAALLKRMQEPGRALSGVMIEVRRDVIAATGGRQVPWDHSALTGEFYFQPWPGVSTGTILQSPAAPAGGGVHEERTRRLHEELGRRPTARP